jgi:hypothetical protein
MVSECAWRKDVVVEQESVWAGGSPERPKSHVQKL